MLFSKNKNTFYCFSPPVMLATFIVEVLLAGYTYFRYKASTFSRLVAVIILLLSGFQLAEYQICGGEDSLIWVRIGFVIITFLPVLGLHLISLITKARNYLKIGYLAMVVFILAFAFIPGSLGSASCGGNYVVFSGAGGLLWPYGLYYFGFIFLAIWDAFEYLQKKKSKALQWIIAGYLTFLLPMGIVYIFAAEVRAAVPSVMCGFAIIMAAILAFKVVPEYNKENKRSKS